METNEGLRVSDNGRYMVRNDGTPFFYMADTAWLMVHRLDREEADLYLETRAEQEFSVIQAVLLTEHGGLSQPNANGDFAFADTDIRRPNEAYFAYVESIVRKASSLGLVVAMLPTWGDKVGTGYWGTGPAGFINEENARYWGTYVGERFGSYPVIWVLGGDRPADCNEHIWREMAAGLRAGESRRHLMTYHPSGHRSSSMWFHYDRWLDFNMAQSNIEPFGTHYDLVRNDYAFRPAKPCLVGEPGYEDHPLTPRNEALCLNDYHVRVSAYEFVFAGACGHTYGCHSVWQFWDPAKRKPHNSPKLPWRESLRLPGAEQMRNLRRLVESRPFLTRIPDQSLIRSGQRNRGPGHIQATRDGSHGNADATYLMAYFSGPNEIKLDTSVIAGSSLRGWWYNTVDGSAIDAGPIAKGRDVTIATFEDNIDRDYLLVVDDESAGYGVPGQPEGQ